MLYRVTFVDGSQELLDAANISEARTAAQDLYDVPIRRLVADGGEEDHDDEDDKEEEDDDNDSDEEDEDEECAINPDDDE